MDVSFMPRKAKMVHPSKVAIKEESGESWTYVELDRMSNVYANQLRAMGIQKGDRVGILLYNCLEYFGLYFAISKLGAIAVRLNFRLSSSELAYALNDSSPKVLCFHSNLTEQLEPIRTSTPVRDYICLTNRGQEKPSWAQDWHTLEKGSEAQLNTDQIKMNDPVMLMYTSGTTGRPKGAIWTHGTTLWFSAMQALKWNFAGAEIGMTTGPLYHVGAMEDIALPILLTGGTVIMTKSRGFQMKRILSVIEEERVTDCFLFPFMIYEMLHDANLTSYQLPHLKTIYTGGDPLLPWVIEKLNMTFPHIGVVQVYGLTEGTPIAAALDPQDAFLKGHTVGKPMPLTDIKIVDEHGAILPCEEVGEIVINSPAISEGYWQNPQATAETFEHGWCKTGDLGKMDQDGYLTIAGRKKDMIRSGGENIYAAEIEDILYRHEAVKDVSIIGIPDSKFIEAVCAVVVKKEGHNLTETEVIAYCKQHLASYKKPKKVIFVDALPRTPSGKVQKFMLRNQYR